MQYSKTAKTQRSRVPGHAYFKKIEDFVDRHFKIGELYMEYVKGNCKGKNNNVNNNDVSKKLQVYVLEKHKTKEMCCTRTSTTTNVLYNNNN